MGFEFDMPINEVAKEIALERRRCSYDDEEIPTVKVCYIPINGHRHGLSVLGLIANSAL